MLQVLFQAHRHYAVNPDCFIAPRRAVAFALIALFILIPTYMQPSFSVSKTMLSRLLPHWHPPSTILIPIYCRALRCELKFARRFYLIEVNNSLKSLAFASWSHWVVWSRQLGQTTVLNLVQSTPSLVYWIRLRYCTAVYCTAQYCTALYCTVLYCCSVLLQLRYYPPIFRKNLLCRELL